MKRCPKCGKAFKEGEIIGYCPDCLRNLIKEYNKITYYRDNPSELNEELTEALTI